MSMTNTRSTHALVNQIIQYSKKVTHKEDVGLVSRFLRLYFLHSDPSDFATRPVEDWYALMISHWKLSQQRRANQLKLRVFNPTLKKDGFESRHTLVQLICQDMPFLVDSMRMEVTRLGYSTHLMIYTGGIRVMRNKKFEITGIYSHHRKTTEGHLEAPIYMEIDRENDPLRLKDIEQNLRRVLEDVSAAVEDWPSMQERLKDSIQEIKNATKLPQSAEDIQESVVFLEWLLDEHFTFLGVRDYEVAGQGELRALHLVPNSGLGVLRDETHSKKNRLFSELPDKAREQLLSPESLIGISKTNTVSTVHRANYTDYIGVKRFDARGRLQGERRFIGLYTTVAYSSPLQAIPFLRDKVETVMKRSELPSRSHAGKDLLYILQSLPRDDLFQATIPELYHLSMGILHMQERPRIRLFLRKDAYGRYVSCLVYVPRENFSTQLIERMQAILLIELHGTEASFTTHFPGSILARVDYIVRLDLQRKTKIDVKRLEKKLIIAGLSWEDGFKEAVQACFGEERGNQLIRQYKKAFPAGYRENFEPVYAVYDLVHMERLYEHKQLEMSLFRPENAEENSLHFKLYSLHHTVPLSDALPMLEHMGLRVIGEQPYKIVVDEKHTVFINDFVMTYPKASTCLIDEIKTIFQESFLHVWLGDAENDDFNRLVLEAHLDWREISLLRAYAKYLRQTGLTFSLEYMIETFIHNPSFAKSLIEIFHLYFNPDIARSVERIKKLEEKFFLELENVASLDEDRILRHYLNLIQSTLRTNFYQLTEEKQHKNYISLKLNSSNIIDLPLPVPKFEVFVYSPRFEGMHLRAARVARGGIRWSDRREDFRTEVLGLMKAQQVKNALIVPAGAKGGFVVKKMPANATREVILEEGIECYRGFIRGLLDITDNYKQGRLVAPKQVVCYDEPDPYLVVAADKGTATFSDIANQLSLDAGFWLGDAFASGGRTGYDHKKMGITAKGAFVSAKRQFQELGINVEEAKITVVGIGDMSGDVFGNGLLMSKNLKLVAAFNHAHIFVDPNPNPAESYLERLRLFNLPRSTWEDYAANLISKGGGVFKRTAKSIAITAEMKAVFDIQRDHMTPSEFIRAILCAPIDLIWNGGVGTFVKSSQEDHDAAGDRTNNALRVNGNELRAKVVCEGGNLGFTQLGRIEYHLNGGKINTDFLDNSAGVDCSDHEVNIKILLNTLVAKEEMTEKQRNILLASMTKEVAELVLKNNYQQNEAISFASSLALKHMGLYMRYMDWLEKNGRLNRALEFLPVNEVLLQRKADNIGLTKPELCILLSYSKNTLEEDIRSTELPDDPYLSQLALMAFPTVLRKRYARQIQQHRLRREIVSTQLSNRLVSDMGIAFVYQMQDETNATLCEIISAYMAAREIFHMPQLYRDIEALDYQVEADTQHLMTNEMVKLVRRAARWFLRNRKVMDIEETIRIFRPYVDGLFKRLPSLLLGNDSRLVEDQQNALILHGVGIELAQKISAVTPMYHALNIIEAAIAHQIDVYRVAKIYFTLVDRLDLFWFANQINDYASDNHWAVLAKASYKGDLDFISRQLTMAVLNDGGKNKTIPAQVNAWFERNKELVLRWETVLATMRSTDLREFSMLAVAIRELADLARTMT